MFILKRSKHEDGMGFVDVHALMAYFKKQVYEDFHEVQTNLDADCLAVFSKILEQKNPKRTFKNISAGPFGFKMMLKDMFPTSISWKYKWFKSIPTNYKRLEQWVDNGNGYLELKTWRWANFFAHFASKDSPILSKEEMTYYWDAD